MKNIRNFSLLTALLSLALCAFAWEAPLVRVAAVTVQKPAWINPYQTDDNALVAMFDGLWNVAGGEPNDAAARRWTELVSGAATDEAALTWTDGRLRCAGATQLVFTNALIDAYFAASNRPFCVEVVASFDTSAKTSGFAGPFVISETAADVANHSFGYQLDYGTKKAYSYTPHYSRYESTMVFSGYGGGVVGFCQNFNGTQASMFTNGVAIEVRNPSGKTDVAARSVLSIGKSFHSQVIGDYFFGDILAIRVYRRELTAAEVAERYALDAWRYGL